MPLPPPITPIHFFKRSILCNAGCFFLSKNIV
nr:MAG TPA: hypothetical protein [Caudoviricetes sp.]